MDPFICSEKFREKFIGTVMIFRVVKIQNVTPQLIRERRARRTSFVTVGEEHLALLSVSRNHSVNCPSRDAQLDHDAAFVAAVLYQAFDRFILSLLFHSQFNLSQSSITSLSWLQDDSIAFASSGVKVQKASPFVPIRRGCSRSFFKTFSFVVC
jgi:hypothetical protein